MCCCCATQTGLREVAVRGHAEAVAEACAPGRTLEAPRHGLRRRVLAPCLRARHAGRGAPHFSKARGREGERAGREAEGAEGEGEGRPVPCSRARAAQAGEGRLLLSTCLLSTPRTTTPAQRPSGVDIAPSSRGGNGGNAPYLTQARLRARHRPTIAEGAVLGACPIRPAAERAILRGKPAMENTAMEHLPRGSRTHLYSRARGKGAKGKGKGHPQGQPKPPSISSEGQKGQCSKTYLAAAAGQVRRRGYVAPRYHGVARWRITPAIASPHRRERCPTTVRIHPHGRPGALAPPHRCG